MSRRQGAVDHRIPVALGGPTDLSNLWLLCDDCNGRKTKADLLDVMRARARG